MKRNKCRMLSGMIAFAMLISGFSPMRVEAEKRANSDVTVNAVEGEQKELGREKLNFNQGWKFKRSYVEEAISPEYNMEELKKWENVDLPHTVRLESYMNSGPGRTYQGDAMYVKHFPLSEEARGKKLYLEFEGAMGVSDVWVNGTHMDTKLASKTGKNTMYGGYLPFILDITEVVKYDGTDNTITVHVDNSDHADVPPGKPARDLDFTYFGGIYRDVWLEVCEPVHITNANYEDIVAGGGILVDYPKVSKESAEVSVQTHVRNEDQTDKNVVIKTEIKDAEGAVVAENTADAATISAGKDTTVKQSLTVKNPKLWNLDTPYMHTLISHVFVDNQEVDTVETPIGIRKIEMHRDYGLKINGEVQEALIGVNRHQEYPYVGYAGSSSLDRRDAIKFKEGGFNVVRTGHYPQSNDFLNACDELGILVIEPTPGWQWYRDNDTFRNRVFNDIRQMVRRDRNHACILAYETVLNETGAPGTFTQNMVKVAKEEHPATKTATESSLQGMPNSAKDTVSDIMYKQADRSDKAVSFQREYGDHYVEQYGPGNLFYRRVARGEGYFYPGGEGAMFMQAVKRLMGNQDDTVYYSKKDGVKGSTYSFLKMAERAETTPSDTEPAFIGSTTWIGIDHNRSYSDNMAMCGLWDLNRIPKFAYYALASQRNVKENAFLKAKGIESGPMLFVASYWNEKAPVLDKSNDEMKVLGTDEKRIIMVYSNVEKVRLKVMKGEEEVWSKEQTPMTGKNREMLNHAPFQFLDVPYQVGTKLVAEGMDKEGKIIATQEVITAGEAKKLELKADDESIDMVADGSDLMMLHTYVKDDKGIVCNQAKNELKFTVVSGDAKIVGDGDKRVGSNPIHAEAGITGVYLKAGKTAGPVVVRVESEALEPAEITINVQAMKEKAAAYTEIEYTGTGGDGSCYLAEKDQLNTWPKLSLGKEKLAVGDKEYRNSLSVHNNMELRYDLEGQYRTLSGSVYVKPEDAGKEAVFRAYVDGVQKYVSPVVKAGEIQQFQIDVSGGNELVLCAEDQNADLETKQSIVWLSPYLYEGKEVVDESELYQNLALGKPAEASSSVGETTAAMGNDGSITTIWRGEEVHEGEQANPQEWIVDLGEKYDVRNAKLGLEHDSITYTYEIYTSSDKKNWDKQITNTKSSQASHVIDEFKAKDVRYVKVRFTEVGEHADRDQLSNATISEFEIYKDMGVDSTREYNLKELSIENKDLVFMPSTKQYTVNLEGYENELRVKAVPFSKDATVKINGKKADGTVVLDHLDKENEIVVEVESKSGAKTKYTVKVEGTLGKIYDSNPAKFKKVTTKGEENWHYAELDKASGKISNITGEPVFVKNGEFCIDGSESYLRSGKRFMHPGNAKNAVRSFTAPKDGTIQLSVAARIYSGNGGETGIYVQKNDKKIWPEKAYETVTEAAQVSDKVITKVKAGDKIHFIVDALGNNGGDGTCVESSVRYLEDFSVTESTLQGPEHIKIYNDQPQDTQYALDVKTDVNQVMQNVKAEWSVLDAEKGVEIDENGMLHLPGDVKEGTITLQAKSKWWPSVCVEKQIKITKHQVEEQVDYLSDLEWIPESDATATGWGVVGKDRICSGKGDNDTKVSLPNEKGERVYYDKGLGVNSRSEIIYDVEGKNYKRFESQIGIDYEKYNNPEASVTFEVWTDDQKVYDSGDMFGKTPSKFVSVDISGAKKVKLVVTLGQDGRNGNDGADWADAKFIRSEDITEYQVAGKVDISQSQLTEAQGLSVQMYAKEDTAFENLLGVGTTDQEGNYQINNKVRNGEYILKINKIEGQCDEAILDIKVEGASIENADFVLQKDPNVPEVPEEPDRSGLEEWLRKADEINREEYTEESLKILDEAYAYGMSVYNDKLAGEQDIKDAEKKLMDAIDGLKKVETSPEEPDPKPENPDDSGNGGQNTGGNGTPSNGNGAQEQQPDKTQKAAKTGDTAQQEVYIVLMLVSMLICVGGSVKCRKRKK